MQTTQILAIRHGQSTWNDAGRWQGRADPPLSELGEHQALEAAKVIGNVDAIVASPQQRAFGTASIIGANIGVGPVDVVDDLAERDIGAWQGLTRSQIDADYPGWVDSGQRPEGWEHDAELEERVLRAFDEVVNRYPGASVLLAAHGGVIIAMERYLGVNEARIPNLHGRVVLHDGAKFQPGEPLALIPDELRTGGQSKAL